MGRDGAAAGRVHVHAGGPDRRARDERGAAAERCVWPEPGSDFETGPVSGVLNAEMYWLAGHNCVWHQQLPSWVTAGNFNAAQLTSIVQNHCSTVVGHFKGKV